MAPNRLTDNMIYMGQLYTPDSEGVPDGVYQMIEEAANLDKVRSTLPNPIANYDGMTVDQVVTELGKLDDAGRAQVMAYERAGAKRKGILSGLS